MIHTGTQGIRFRLARTIRVRIIKTLSANGSKDLPKEVISFLVLAAYPSSPSVKPAIIKIIAANKSLPGIFHNKMPTQTGARINLNAVSQFAKFMIFFLSKYSPFGIYT